MVLMLTVVLCHSVSFWCGEWFTVLVNERVIKPLSVISGWTGSFHVYAFTLVSGYLFYYLKIECLKYENFLLFLLNKIKRLIVPYIFISIIWVIPITQFYYNYSIQDLLFKYILAINPSQLWFLWMLFWVYMLFCPIAKIVDNKPFLGCIIAMFLFGAGNVAGHFIPNLFNVLTGFQFIVFFYAGFVLRKYEKRINEGILAICLCVIHIVLFSVKLYFHFSKIISFGLDFVIHMSGAIGVFLLLQYVFTRFDSLAQICQVKLKLLVQHSMSIYLFHQQIIYFVLVLFYSIINPYLHAVLCFLISISASLVISFLLSKFRIGKIAIGEK